MNHDCGGGDANKRLCGALLFHLKGSHHVASGITRTSISLVDIKKTKFSLTCKIIDQQEEQGEEEGQMSRIRSIDFFLPTKSDHLVLSVCVQGVLLTLLVEVKRRDFASPRTALSLSPGCNLFSLGQSFGP